jgi:hypothetical protein
MGNVWIILEVGGSGAAYNYCYDGNADTGLQYYDVKSCTIGIQTTAIQSPLNSSVKQKNVHYPATVVTLDGSFSDPTELELFETALKSSAGRTASNNTFKVKEDSTEIFSYNFICTDCKIQFDAKQTINKWPVVLNLTVQE